MKPFFRAMVVLALSFPAMLYPSIQSFSRVLPDMPTERDSISIETYNCFSYGKLIDSSLSISGKDINIHYTFVDSLVMGGVDVKRKEIGRLPSGYYRIITRGFFIRTRDGSMDTTGKSLDTVDFEVLPDTMTPPRVVAYKAFDTYPFVNDFYPKRSYYYWNGDTLSIGMAFYMGATGLYFIPRIHMASDTFVLALICTTYTVAPAFSGYLTSTTLAPLPKSVYHVRIHMGSWHVSGKSLDTGFHHFTADPGNSGIGLSFREPGRTEYILYPNDTMYMAFPILSPFLDTLNILGFQPNPYYKPTGTNRIFLHDIHHGNTLIENWETFDKNDWQYVSVQESDRIAFDTVSNSTNGDHWIRMTYSNENDKPVKGYYYKTLDQPLVSSLALPSVGIYGAIKPDSAVTPVVQQPSLAAKTRTAPVVDYTGAHITVRFASGHVRKVTVTDTRGRMVRVLGVKDMRVSGNGTLAVWDKRDDNGRPVPRGIYVLRTAGSPGSGCAVAVVR